MNAKLPGPLWLRNLFGEDFFSDVDSVDFVLSRVTDSGLARLKDLPRLWGLNLSSTKVTDAGLERLGECVRLTDVSLADTLVTDGGLEYLKALSQLHWLRICQHTGHRRRREETPAGIAELQDNPLT